MTIAWPPKAPEPVDDIYYEVEIDPVAFRALVRLVDKGTRPAPSAGRAIVEALKAARVMEGKIGELRSYKPDWDRLTAEARKRGGWDNLAFDAPHLDDE